MTHGHVDLMKRAVRLFDRVVVAMVAESVTKKPCFSLSERIGLAKTVLSELGDAVEVCAFSGLLIDFVRQKQASIIVRGIRAVSDFEYEFQMASMNRCMDDRIETVFLTPAEPYAHIASSLVREIAFLGGDVTPFVDPVVRAALKAACAGAKQSTQP